MIRHVFKEAIDVDLDAKVPVMEYAEAMRRFGSDKPDLRVKLEFTELTDVMGDVDFKGVLGAGHDRRRSRGCAARAGRCGDLA